MSASKVAPPACEFERAYREMIEDPHSLLPATPCSPETPEAREYPPAHTGSPRYVLCNGHLSDLFDARERSAHPSEIARLTPATS